MKKIFMRIQKNITKIPTVKPKIKYGYVIGRYSHHNHLVVYRKPNRDEGIDYWTTNISLAGLYETSEKAEAYRRKKSKGRKNKTIFISKVKYVIKKHPYSGNTINAIQSLTKINSYQMIYNLVHKL